MDSLPKLKRGSYISAATYCQFIVAISFRGIKRPDSEYFVPVLVLMKGKLINSIEVPRNILSNLSNKLKMQNRTGNKKTESVLSLSNGISYGKIGPFPEVTRECEKMALSIVTRDSSNIQCHLMGRKVCIFDFNSRFRE